MCWLNGLGRWGAEGECEALNLRFLGVDTRSVRFGQPRAGLPAWPACSTDGSSSRRLTTHRTNQHGRATRANMRPRSAV